VLPVYELAGGDSGGKGIGSFGIGESGEEFGSALSAPPGSGDDPSKGFGAEPSRGLFLDGSTTS
jgi:hypothetical protein